MMTTEEMLKKEAMRLKMAKLRAKSSSKEISLVTTFSVYSWPSCVNNAFALSQN